MDLLIAAHALSLSLTLVTNSTAEFGVFPVCAWKTGSVSGPAERAGEGTMAAG